MDACLDFLVYKCPLSQVAVPYKPNPVAYINDNNIPMGALERNI